MNPNCAVRSPPLYQLSYKGQNIILWREEVHFQMSEEYFKK
jgi:hypothetical protein